MWRYLLVTVAAAWCVTVGAQTVVVYTTADIQHALRAYGLARVWGPAFIARDLIPGHPWRADISTTLCAADQVLVLWSEAASKSLELRREIDVAIACDRRIIPVMLDSYPLPVELSSLHAVDWR